MKQAPTVITRAARSEAIALTDAIKTGLRTVAQTFWDIGDNLRRVRERSLYRALAYESFDAYVRSELGVQVRQALKMLRVVRSYTRSDASEIGLERSAALIRLCHARGGGTEPGEVIRANAEIAPGIPVRSATVDQIDAAARAAKHAHAIRLGRAPAARQTAREERAEVSRLRKTLAAAGFPRAKITLRGTDAHVVLPRARIPD